MCHAQMHKKASWTNPLKPNRKSAILIFVVLSYLCKLVLQYWLLPCLYAYFLSVWQHALIVPHTCFQWGSPCTVFCIKFDRHVYCVQTYKKGSWTHTFNPTGSQPFWILSSFFAVSTPITLGNSSYSIDLVLLKFGMSNLNTPIMRIYQRSAWNF